VAQQQLLPVISKNSDELGKARGGLGDAEGCGRTEGCPGVCYMCQMCDGMSDIQRGSGTQCGSPVSISCLPSAEATTVAQVPRKVMCRLGVATAVLYCHSHHIALLQPLPCTATAAACWCKCNHLVLLGLFALCCQRY